MSTKNTHPNKEHYTDTERPKSNEKKHMSKKRLKKKRRKRILIIEVIILIMLLSALFAWFKIGKIDWNDLGEVVTNNLNDETKEMLKGYTTFAIFGVDNRTMGDYDTGNSDSIMVCSIDNDTKQVKIMSVYRDTYVDIGDGKFRKCNAAYSNGGPEQALAMLNKNIDLNIQDYMAVDFEAVIGAVDAVGGVEIEVLPEEVQYLNSYLVDVANHTGHSSPSVGAGLQTLDGAQALAYCRIRYTAGDDFRRTERQRTVISKLIEKAKDANIFQLNSMINAVFPKISTSLSLTQAIGLAKNMKGYELSDTSGWPIDMRAVNQSDKGDIIAPCTLESNVRKAYEFLYNDPTHEPSDTVKEISEYIRSSTGCDESDAVNYINWNGAQ